MKKEPSVAIIIVNWNGRDDTDACLQSLRALSYANYKIILVDNGSSDGSVIFFSERYPGVEIIENEQNLGFTGGNNAGIQKALSEDVDYVLLLNNDTICHEPDFLVKMVEACESNAKIGMACPTIFYDEPADKVWYAGGWLNLWRGWGHYYNVPEDNKVKITGYTTGCCLLVKSKTIDNIGLLNDAYFLSVEDVEWSLRAQNSGWETVYVPAASIIHKDSRSSRSEGRGTYSPARIYYEFRNSIWFIREYANPVQKIGVWPVYFTLQFMYRAGAYVILGRFKKLQAISRACKDGISAAGKRFKEKLKTT